MSEIFKESDFIPRSIPKLHIVRFGVLGSFDADFQKNTLIRND